MAMDMTVELVRYGQEQGQKWAQIAKPARKRAHAKGDKIDSISNYRRSSMGNKRHWIETDINRCPLLHEQQLSTEMAEAVKNTK